MIELDPGFAHLEEAVIELVWTNHDMPVPGSSGELAYDGWCEIPRQSISGKVHQKLRHQDLVRSWFPWVAELPEIEDGLPDFMITLSAPAFAWKLEREPRLALQVPDHELWHCGTKRQYGDVKRNPITGRPIWAINPHPIERFPKEWERWGFAPDERALLERLLAAEPTMGPALEGFACGTCPQAS